MNARPEHGFDSTTQTAELFRDRSDSRAKSTTGHPAVHVANY